MATIEKRGDTYRIIVSAGYNSAGKQIRKRLTWVPPTGLTPHQLKKALNVAAVEFENKVKTGQYIKGDITLADFTARWIEEYGKIQLAETTLYSYRMALKDQILPALGHIQLGKLQPIQIQSFLNNLLEDGVRKDGKPGGYGARTVKYMQQILSSILHTAVYWQVILSNPCERVKPPAKKDAPTPGRVKHFTDEQVGRFLEAIEGEPLKYRLLANIGIYVGSRKGEMLGLTWADVDLDAGTLFIDKVGSYTPEKGLFIKDTPKNVSSVRSVELIDRVIVLLRLHKKEQAEDRLRLGELWQNQDLIFTQWNGLQMHTSTPRQWMGRFIDRYNTNIMKDNTLADGEKSTRLLPKIPFHGLRHTSATLMIAGHVDIRTVSARLGHARTSTTTDIYSHFLKTSDKKAALTIEGMIAGAKSSL